MRNKLIQIFKEYEGEFVSGEQIGELLGVSRTAIWKNIKGLINDGYTIEKKHRIGYKLIDEPKKLDMVKLKELANDYKLEITLDYLETVTSTNMVIKERKDLPDGYILLADEQTAGKGRLERQWYSPKGKGIWLSIMLRPSIPPEQIPMLTLLGGYAVSLVIEELYNIEAKIKWPNDIIIRGKKVCGILTELKGELERIDSVIMGIGVNTGQSRADIPEELSDKATSLYIETGVVIDREELISKLLDKIFSLYHNEKVWTNLINLYSKKCITIGNEVIVKTPWETYNGRAVKIGPTGALIVETDGYRREIIAGDVSIRTLNGYV
jgi:BirA family biotin operon repressor/biotin-[acetyl-CoA-carboxylase] ligase